MDIREAAESLLSTTTVDLNAANGTKTTLFTCPAGKSCIITKVIMHNLVGAGAPLNVADISFGWDAGGLDVIDTAVRACILLGYVIILPETDGDAKAGVAAGTFKLCLTVQEGAVLSADFAVFGYLY